MIAEKVLVRQTRNTMSGVDRMVVKLRVKEGALTPRSRYCAHGRRRSQAHMLFRRPLSVWTDPAHVSGQIQQPCGREGADV